MTTLIADIGGTYSRCALVDESRIHNQSVFLNSEFDGVEHVLWHYINMLEQPVGCAAIAIAAPVTSGEIKMPNTGWKFSQERLSQHLGVPLVIVNDFEILADSVPDYTEADLLPLNDIRFSRHLPCAVLGPGTGLGASLYIPHAGSIATEGGNIVLGSTSTMNKQIVGCVEKAIGQVTAESLVSGEGLKRIYRSVKEIYGSPAVPHISTEGIFDEARSHARDAQLAVRAFFDFLAEFAANYALSTGARGGIIIAGGIVPQTLDLLDIERFAEAFQGNKRYQSYLSEIGIAVLVRPHPAFVGLAKIKDF